MMVHEVLSPPKYQPFKDPVDSLPIFIALFEVGP